MRAFSRNYSMSEKELGQLDNLLSGLGKEAMNIEKLDGFFCALICAPDLVKPSEYTQRVIGFDTVFSDEEQVNSLFKLLNQHWNTIASTLHASLNDKTRVYFPIMLEDKEGIIRGNDWAEGFMEGVQMRLDDWQELLSSEEHGGGFVPIMMLLHEHDPDPTMRTPTINAQDRDEKVIPSLIAGLMHMYRYFEPHRRKMAEVGRSLQSYRRETPKIGRNEPCPCGSRYKYKNCCGNTLTSNSVH